MGGGAPPAGAASFVVTSGKRFRFTTFTVASRGHATATAQITKFTLRINSAGAVVTGSNTAFTVQTATPATALAYDRLTLNFEGEGTRDCRRWNASVRPHGKCSIRDQRADLGRADYRLRIYDVSLLLVLRSGAVVVAGIATGLGATSGIGNTSLAGFGSAPSVSSVSGVGKINAGGTGSSAGAAGGSATSSVRLAGTGSGVGTATTSGVGSGRATSQGTSSGLGFASGVSSTGLVGSGLASGLQRSGRNLIYTTGRQRRLLRRGGSDRDRHDSDIGHRVLHRLCGCNRDC
jgi:hypothetical protein